MMTEGWADPMPLRSPQYIRGDNYDTGVLYCQKNQLPGGSLFLEVVECENIIPADATGKTDPFVQVTFSQGANLQQARTPTMHQTLSPKFTKKNKFEFNLMADNDVVKFELYDRDLFPTPRKELLCKCTTDIGLATQHPAQGFITLYLHPKEKKDSECPGHIDGGCGTVTVKVDYRFNSDAHTHATVDAAAAEPDKFAYKKLMDAITRFSEHMSYAMMPLWYWLDTCMWVRPFESAFWLLFFFCATFLFENVLSAFFPGLMAALFVRSYIYFIRYGYKGPEQEEYVPQPLKKILHDTQINLNYYSDLLDDYHEIYSWKRKGTAMMLTKGFAIWTGLILFFPWFPSFGYWFFLFILYMYTLYPLYIWYPRLQYVHAKRLQSVIDMVNLRTFELNVAPYLPGKVVEYIPKSDEAKLLEEVEAQMPPLPAGDLPYAEWKALHASREEQKSLIELKKSGFLNERGQPVCDARNGRLHVRVISASDFKADSGGRSDPFVKLRIGTRKYQTSTKSRTLAPVWNEDFIFREVGYLSGVLSIMLLDDNYTRDASLGTCQLKLETVVKGVERTIDVELLNGGPDAKVTLSVKGEGPCWPSERESSLLQKLTRLRKETKEKLLREQPPDTRVGRLHVKLMHGAGLKICDMKTSDPFVQMHLEGPPHHTQRKPVKSATVKNSLMPVWNEDHVIDGVSTSHRFCIECFDEDIAIIGTRSDDMGTGSYSLAKLFENDPEEVDIPLSLKGRPEGVITVSLRAEGFARRLEDVDKAMEVRRASLAPSPQHGSPSPPQPHQHQQPPVAAQTPPPTARPEPVSYQGGGGGSTLRQRVDASGGSLTCTIESARGVRRTRNGMQLQVKLLLTNPVAQTTKKVKTLPANAGAEDPKWHVVHKFSELPADALRTHRLDVELWDDKAQGEKGERIASGVCDVRELSRCGTLNTWATVFHAGVQAGEVQLSITSAGLQKEGLAPAELAM